MRPGMSRTSIARFVNPWNFRREQAEERVRALRRRDGENCARCRRPIRFDPPDGHDSAARIETIGATPAGEAHALENLLLTHVRCNAQAGDDTETVQERVRLKAEAALFASTRRKRRRA